MNYAIEHDLVLVTVNRKDFDQRYYERSRSGLEHPGLIIIHPARQKNYQHIGEMLALYSSESMADRVEWI
jgi:hypothetical protein